MGEERVDKTWQKKGLSSFSTAQILGTLGHYGVGIDEEKCRDLMLKSYPLELALDWQKSWKGKGQFARFHWVAADELWARFQPDRLSPVVLAQALAGLISALRQMLHGAPDAPVGKAFAEAARLIDQVPLEGDRPVERFVEDALARLGDEGAHLGKLAVELAAQGHLDDARDLARIEERLLPDLNGISQAHVRAAGGDPDQARRDLEAILADPARHPRSKLAAVDVLIQLDVYAEATRAAERLFDEAQTQGDYHFGFAVADRLIYLLEKAGDQERIAGFSKKLHELSLKHDEAHPGHRKGEGH